MSDHIPEVPLGDLLAAIIDHRGKTPKKLGGDFTDSGVPVVSAIHIKGGRIKWDERERFVSKAMFEKWMPVRLQKGDLLLTSEAPLGEVALVPTDDDLTLSQRLFALRGDPELLDTQYLGYFLSSPAGQRKLQERASGSTVLGIRQAELVKLTIPLPPLVEQQRIAGVLGALDDLIEADRALVASLDQLFQAEWDSRFLEAQRSATAPLASICTTQYGFTDAATSDPDGPKFVRVADINKQNWIEWDSVPHCSPTARAGHRYRLRKGDLVVARMADPGKAARVESDVDAVFASYLVRLNLTNPDLSLYVYGFLKSDVYADYARGAMTGSVQKNMNAKIIAAINIALPIADEIASFNAFGDPIRDQISQLLNEIQQLRSTRDELLPLLLSGAVTVAEAAA